MTQSRKNDLAIDNYAAVSELPPSAKFPSASVNVRRSARLAVDDEIERGQPLQTNGVRLQEKRYDFLANVTRLQIILFNYAIQLHSPNTFLSPSLLADQT